MLQKEILAAALEYAGYGWRVVPISRATKAPILKGWQNKASVDPEIITHWFSREFADANVGVVLGRTSNLIDFEVDSVAEHEVLLDVFDHDMPATANFRSFRGRHWLFEWRPDLPGGAVYDLVHRSDPRVKLKVRIGNDGLGAQSVFPPSVHPTGTVYMWEAHPSCVPVAKLPDHVVERLLNWHLPLIPSHRPESKAKATPTPASRGVSLPAEQVEHVQGRTADEWRALIDGSAQGSRNSDAATLVGKYLSALGDLTSGNLDLVWMSLVAWNSRCKPPLDDRELRRTFDSILKREQARREAVERGGLLVAGDTPSASAPEAAAETWRMVIVERTPKEHLIYGPLHQGAVSLTSHELMHYTSALDAFCEQASIRLPDALAKRGAWADFTGRLLASATRVASLPVDDLLKIGADHLLEQIDSAPSAGDADEPHPHRMVVRADGSVWFRWRPFWIRAEKEHGIDRRAERQVKELLGIKGEDCPVWGSTARGGARHRYTRLDSQHLMRLKQAGEWGI